MIDDPVLPAAAHFTGGHAVEMLRAAVVAAGGELFDASTAHLQYRPGHDAVASYRTTVAWGDGNPVRETLMAATTAAGPPAGTLPVEAITDAGETMQVGVWRWPFDPVLQGLGDAVTPAAQRDFLADLEFGTPALRVVSFRPLIRSVVRATARDGRVVYVKAVPPPTTASLVRRHELLAAAGLPVPEVLASDADRGLVALAELGGTNLSKQLKLPGTRLPGAARYAALFDSLAATDLTPATMGPHATVPEGRACTGILHARMLGTVVTGEHERLERLTDALQPAMVRAAARRQPTIHGDMYSAQLMVNGATITGVLDVDDAGPGDPYDDPANLLAHLLVRALDVRRDIARLRRYARRLRTDLTSEFGFDGAELDIVTAGALTGLATGPFRTQSPGWPSEVAATLALADRLVRFAGERTLRIASSSRHRGVPH